ncbi:MAG: GntP family permease [Bacteroidota bacterium]|nr:GntP family permease [Bacteroidota bacterium]
MAPSFLQVLLSLLAGISLIVVLTARLKVHPFFALLLASGVVGLGVQLPLPDIITAAKDGFGNILKSLGFIIVLGTALGVILERNGSTQVMANYILKKIGDRYPALAMSIIGFVVGLPIFCDSGFIVLSGLNVTLAKRTGTRVIVMAVSMATGLYAVHCLIPPHPGAAAAAGMMDVPFGKLIITGILVGIPAMLVGYLYAGYAGNRVSEQVKETTEEIKNSATITYPSVFRAFLPVLVPIILIAGRSVFENTLTGNWQILTLLGDPVMALSVGVLLALSGRSIPGKAINQWLQEAVEKAGGILVIIGAGGAFGAVLAATHIGQHLSESLPLATMGIFFPFLLTSFLKTAQGSSTVAIITAASIIQPLLHQLGFDTPDQRLYCVLAMGAGSMMISHANDAYFWVIAKFEKIDMSPMLKVYSVATLLMGLTTIGVVYVLTLFR